MQCGFNPGELVATRVEEASECCASIGTHQVNADGWLVHGNNERPDVYYRRLGQRPLEAINARLSVAKEGSQCTRPSLRSGLRAVDGAHFSIVIVQ
jgi:hypothetical protein